MSSYKLEKPRLRTDICTCWLIIRVVNDWNTLGKIVVSAEAIGWLNVWVQGWQVGWILGRKRAASYRSSTRQLQSPCSCVLMFSVIVFCSNPALRKFMNCKPRTIGYMYPLPVLSSSSSVLYYFSTPITEITDPNSFLLRSPYLLQSVIRCSMFPLLYKRCSSSAIFLFCNFP